LDQGSTAARKLDQRRPLVKICGLTRRDDVLLAAELGAWAVGFIFAPSPRRLTPTAARPLVDALKEEGRLLGAPLPAERPLAIGVFDEAPAEKIAAAVRQADLDGVQFHTGERPGRAAVKAALGEAKEGLLFIQAVAVPRAMPAGEARSFVDSLEQSIARAREDADIVLLDTVAGGAFGGSGVGFPWHAAREAGDGAPLLIAGGIRPSNANTALHESGAWGIDVSSGVEAAPGVKDPSLLRQLFAAVASPQHCERRRSVAGGEQGKEPR
jgi:phosphoribosylanthranilate isomerase